jgi:hypothetical protein
MAKKTYRRKSRKNYKKKRTMKRGGTVSSSKTTTVPRDMVLPEFLIKQVLSRINMGDSYTKEEKEQEMKKLRDYFENFTYKSNYTYYYPSNKNKSNPLLGQAIDIAERWNRDGADVLV